jgi:hypothetical protein
MKRIVFVLSLLMTTSTIASAQTAEDAIAKAVLAAPPAMQAGAMVIQLAADGDHEVLRDGTNGLVCWDRSDEPGRSFSVQCTSVENLPRVKQNRAWNMSGQTADEIRAVREAAEADGSRKVSVFGSVYYTLNGEDAASANLHLTVAVPFATSESLGLPSEGSYSRAGTWIMEAGLSAAHIMLPGR